MSNELAIRQEYSPEQVDLIKATVASGTTDAELALFLHQCQRTGLDPLSNQIHCIKRKSKNKDGSWSEKVTIQTGIDGYRLIADRTGRFAPGDVVIKMEGTKIVSAIATVKKCVGGTWFDVKAEAYYDEYVQTYYSKESSKWEPTGLWKKMPRIMLAKCAEALALRRAFPAELSGLYTDDEMRQADAPAPAEERPVVIEQDAPNQIASYPDQPQPVQHPEDAEMQIKRQILALLIKTGVPKNEHGPIGEWLIKWVDGDLDAALSALAGWDAQGLRFDLESRVWKPVEQSA